MEAVLTIDDLSSGNTPAIVDYLKKKGICATMFAVGQNVERYPEEAVYAVKKGMILGNHSYSHPGFSSLTMDQAKEEIDKTEEILNRVYETAGVERRYRPFRFPYGDKGGTLKDELQLYLRTQGFHKLKDTQIFYAGYAKQGLHEDIDTYWTFDFAEWQIPHHTGFTEQDAFKRMDEENPADREQLFTPDASHILLLHAHDETEEIVPGYYKHFIDYLLKKGMQFRKPEFEIQ